MSLTIIFFATLFLLSWVWLFIEAKSAFIVDQDSPF